MSLALCLQLTPLVDGGVLLLEHDEPLLEEAEAALLSGWIVSLEPLCKDGPAELDRGASVLELPHIVHCPRNCQKSKK